VKTHCSLLAAIGGLAVLASLTSAAHAQNVTTDPVGAITITLKGNSDTLVSLPFHRPVALETQVSSITGNVINISASANITGNQFIYSAGNQTNHYYVQFTSGNRAGMFYTITANTPTTITVDGAGDTGLTGNVGTSDTFRVIPYCTLNTLFPNGQGINQSAGFTGGQRKSAIFVVDNVSSGFNLAALTSYYYYNGSSSPGAGWRQAGDTGNLTNDVVIYPDNYFFVRNSIAGDTQLTLVGAVPQSKFATPLSTIAGNTTQDNFIGVSVPVSVTLASSNLQQSGAFLASTGFIGAQRGDQLFVFDNTVATINRASVATYYYYGGSNSGGPGWRLAGDPNGNTAIHDNDAIFQPGNGYIIRKKATTSPQSVIWTFAPAYLP